MIHRFILLQIVYTILCNFFLNNIAWSSTEAEMLPMLMKVHFFAAFLPAFYCDGMKKTTTRLFFCTSWLLRMNIRASRPSRSWVSCFHHTQLWVHVQKSALMAKSCVNINGGCICPYCNHSFNQSVELDGLLGITHCTAGDVNHSNTDSEALVILCWKSWKKLMCILTLGE